MLDLDAKKIRMLIDGPGNNSYPAWSSDGRLLAFTSDRDGNKEIYLSDWEGQRQVRLTENKNIDDNAAWIPNSKRLVYYAEANENSTDLFMLDLESVESPLRLTRLGGRNTTPKVSPDGNKIAYSTNRNWPGWDVCIWDMVNAQDKCVLEGAQTYCRPDFSPDGRELAYSFGFGKQINLAVMNLEKKSNLPLSKIPLREYDATFAPSGSHIAFSAEDGVEGNFKLYALEKNSKRSWALVSSKYSIRYLSWSGVSNLQLEAQRMIEKQKLEETQRLNLLGAKTNTAGAE